MKEPQSFGAMLSFFWKKEYKDVIKQEFGSCCCCKKEWLKILKKYAAIANSYACKIIRTENHSSEYSRY